jgi:hypothetical protein
VVAMSRMRDTGGELPWPTAHLCGDGKVRNLAEYVPGQWYWKGDWHAERSSIAHSLARKALPEISAMTGSDGPQPLVSW